MSTASPLGWKIAGWICLLLIALPARAQEAPALEARTNAPTVQAGDPFTFTVHIGSDANPVPNLYGVGLQLHFDPAVFEVTAYQAGSLFAGHLGGLNPQAEEIFKLVGPDDDLDGSGTADGESYFAYGVTLLNPAPAVTGNGAVVEITMKARADAPLGSYPFHLEEVAVTAEGGASVAVTPSAEAVAIDDTRAARRRAFSAGDPAAYTFTALDDLRLDLAGLDAEAEVLARRIVEAFTGTTLPGDYAPAAEGYWQITQSGATQLEAQVCFPFSLVTDQLVDRSQLRILKRADATHGWQVLTTSLLPDATNPAWVCATVTSFSDFVLAAPAAALPVELTAFEARPAAEAVVLTWRTASETNNAGFEVQRRAGTAAWQRVGYVEGAGTTAAPQAYRFVDGALPAQARTVAYRLKQVDYDGAFTYSPVVEVAPAAPQAFTLQGNYPNPFNPATTIRYTLPAARHVTLQIFDVLGREVRTLVDRAQEAGRYAVPFEASGLPSGLYLYRLRAGDFTATRTMLLAE